MRRKRYTRRHNTIYVIVIILLIAVIAFFFMERKTLLKRVNESKSQPTVSSIEEQIQEKDKEIERKNEEISELKNRLDVATTAIKENVVDTSTDNFESEFSPSKLITLEEESPRIQLWQNVLNYYASAEDALYSSSWYEKESRLTFIVSGCTLKSATISSEPLIVNVNGEEMEVFSGEENCQIVDTGDNVYVVRFNVVPMRNTYIFHFSTANGTDFYTAVEVSF